MENQRNSVGNCLEFISNVIGFVSYFQNGKKHQNRMKTDKVVKNIGGRQKIIPTHPMKFWCFPTEKIPRNFSVQFFWSHQGQLALCWQMSRHWNSSLEAIMSTSWLLVHSPSTKHWRPLQFPGFGSQVKRNKIVKIKNFILTLI